MSNKVPTSIVDKNGRQTTVHKNPDSSSTSLRLQAPRPFVIARTPEEVKSKQLAFIRDLSHDYRAIVPGTVAIEIGTQHGNPYIVRALDSDGKPINKGSEFATPDAVDGTNRSLRNLDYILGNDLGYIDTTKPNSLGALFTLDLDKADDVVATNAIDGTLTEILGESSESMLSGVKNALDADYENNFDPFKRFYAVRDFLWDADGDGVKALSAAHDIFEKIGLDDEIDRDYSALGTIRKS